MAVLQDPPQKRNRTRSPSYPYIALPAALEKAAALWQVEGRHAAAVNVVMQHWGYKEDSSTGYSCVAALKKFGLVDHEGMGDGRQIRLSELALAILLDKNPESPERRDALRRAALAPRIHAELWEMYASELPSDQSLKRFLVLERAFNEASVDELLDEYKATMAFAGLNVGTGSAGPEAAAAIAARAAVQPVNTASLTGVPAAMSLGVRPPLVATTMIPPARPTMPAPAPAGASLPPVAVGAPRLVPNGNGYQDQRQDAPSNAATAPARPPARIEETWQAGGGETARRGAGAAFGNGRGQGLPPTPVGQRNLFGEVEADEYYPVAPGVEGGEDAPLTRSARAAQLPEATREDSPMPSAAPWSVAHRELPVPLDNDRVARVPYPMTEEDFSLLIDTLQLWKKRLVQPGR